ncbi:piggyBac transposable element-derived protein 3-like [Metopolophium dirhodum]|uniref:piggyBac transposable element-derived protein 3-like n=1 Tax=Metopolophium dirhodum TaxID=44670 RepID=UPI00298FCDC4|nr:piggyBac transposable element-derived protein 3-like [Metopolophium dirhodum]
MNNEPTTSTQYSSTPASVSTQSSISTEDNFHWQPWQHINFNDTDHLVANWDESDDDVECSDDENEMFMYETENYETFDPDLELDINSLPIIFEDEGEYITIPNNECSVINQPKLFNNEALTLDICEPGPSSSNIYLDTSKNNKYESTTYPNPSVIQSARTKTLRPKFSRKLIESTQKRFEEIRRFIHFNDNNKMLEKEDIHYDRLYKIRPLIDHLNNKFNSIPYPRDLSLDEQLCATKARSYLKKYMPAKPHKWGFEFFVLCDSKGFSYQFEIYSGQENDQRFRLLHEPDLGASSNIVVRLTRNIPRHKNHRIYFDNFYTSIPLASYLYQNGILCLGTVRKDRLPNNKIPNDQIIKKDERGKSYEYLTVYENTPMSVTSWKDNRQVNLLSTYCGSLPMLTANRFDKKLKKKINIDCPTVIKEYNRFMGGVDLLDSLIGRYKVRMRSRKWYMRIFYHLIDTSVVNSWLLYKRTQSQLGKPSKYTLVDWRKSLAYTLTRIGFVQTPTRGRPSLESSLKKQNRTRPTQRPTQDIRTDNIGHYINHIEKKGRCKFPNCKGYTNFQCSKCNVYLCNLTNISQHSNEVPIEDYIEDNDEDQGSQDAIEQLDRITQSASTEKAYDQFGKHVAY